MELLPLFMSDEKIPNGIQDYCIETKIGNGNNLKYFKDGAAFPVNRAYESCISGGAYKDFLSSIQEKDGKDFCLIFIPQNVLIPLPCPDGYGTVSEEEPETAGGYSESMCCNYIYYDKPKPYLRLYDDELSFTAKIKIAQASGLSLGFCPYKILEKIKALV